MLPDLAPRAARCMRKRSSISAAWSSDRLAVAGQDELARASRGWRAASPCRRPARGAGRPSGVGGGLGQRPARSAGWTRCARAGGRRRSGSRRSLVPEDRVRRAVAGAVSTRSVRSRELQLVAVAQRHASPARWSRRRGTRRPPSRSAVARSSGTPWRRMTAMRELVVGARRCAEVLQVGASSVKRRDLGARAPGEDLEQARGGPCAGG